MLCCAMQKPLCQALLRITSLSPSTHTHTHTSIKLSDAHKALELLEEYRKKLSGTDNEELREALSKAIVAIRSRLFQALLGKLYISCVFTFQVDFCHCDSISFSWKNMIFSQITVIYTQRHVSGSLLFISSCFIN